MKTLFIGCHCDDIELGCGATINKNQKKWDIFCHILCKDGFKNKKIINLEDATKKSLQNLGVSSKNITFSNFEPDKYELYRNEIWNVLNQLKVKINPDFVVSQIKDEHQDHITLYNESVRVFREKNLYFYLSALRSQKSFDPDVYEIVSKIDIDKKNDSIKIYKKILGNKNYFDKKNIISVAKTNGIYIKSDYAEVFKVFTKINLS